MLETLSQLFSEICVMAGELFDNVLHSTAQGFIGVGLISVYFVLILAAAVMRIRRGEHMGQH